MAKLDLTSEQWCELVFEGRNKDYGAYYLRRSSSVRHNKAMLIVMVVAVVCITLPYLIKAVMPVQQTKEVITEVTTLSQLPPPEVKSEAIKKVNAAPPPPLKSTIKFTAPVIKKDEEVREEDEIKTQEEVTNSKVAISVADVKGNDDENGADIADLKEIAQDEPQDTPFQVVEQMPEYPGGRAAMMKYIGKMMKYPTIAMENGIEGKVILRFVVLPTGEIGNVEVLRSLDPTCDKEAVRVVQGMPKWIPGKQNGTAVSVYFTLPIAFLLLGSYLFVEQLTPAVRYGMGIVFFGYGCFRAYRQLKRGVY